MSQVDKGWAGTLNRYVLLGLGTKTWGWGGWVGRMQLVQGLQFVQQQIWGKTLAGATSTLLLKFCFKKEVVLCCLNKLCP